MADQIRILYEEIRKQFEIPQATFPRGEYPKLLITQRYLTSEFVDGLIEACMKLYNQIDSAVETLRRTVPIIHKELSPLIKDKLLGGLDLNYMTVNFQLTGYSSEGKIVCPATEQLPFGIKSVIDLLVKTVENMEAGARLRSDEHFLTARVAYFALKVALTQFLTRFDYVMMYPHRIVLDRAILETGLRKHGMDNIVGYVQSAEEHFNNQKYVEFCAMSRNALQDTVKAICLSIDGEEHGFPNNCNKLEEIGFLRSTIMKQMKEFSGSLSACGSHPPEKRLLVEEAKFLLDSLYGFLGLLTLRLSTFQGENKTTL